MEQKGYVLARGDKRGLVVVYRSQCAQPHATIRAYHEKQ